MKRTEAVPAIDDLVKCGVVWPKEVRLQRCRRRLVTDPGVGRVASRTRPSISIGALVALVLVLAAAVVVTACGGATSGGEDLTRDRARELGLRLTGELRAYRDNGLEADLRRAEATCADIESAATKIRSSATDYGRVLVSACEAVDLLEVDPRLTVQSAISLVDLALGLLE